MRRLRLSPEANSDLEAAIDWLAARNPRAASRLYQRMRQKFAALSDAPGAGIPSDGMRAGMRRAIVRPYVVYYRTDSSVVEIVRILHGRRDHDAIFSGED
jgi:toxin ParE1/3/4